MNLTAICERNYEPHQRARLTQGPVPSVPTVVCLSLRQVLTCANLRGRKPARQRAHSCVLLTDRLSGRRKRELGQVASRMKIAERLDILSLSLLLEGKGTEAKRPRDGGHANFYSICPSIHPYPALCPRIIALSLDSAALTLATMTPIRHWLHSPRLSVSLRVCLRRAIRVSAPGSRHDRLHQSILRGLDTKSAQLRATRTIDTVRTSTHTHTHTFEY
ncbi:unnamed protein product, partial [Protopolystoma xenopodis]